LAKVLREKGAKTVSLYVTHGMFTKGKEIFNGILDGVHCYFDYTKENMQ
jgi:ribose-phosphate pyrophosphokinase